MKSQQTALFFHIYAIKRLTPTGLYGLMLPVARIAQSVEQGIENPRVLGSIPSPGTIFRRTRLWRVFRFLEYGLLRSISQPNGLPLRANAKALFNTAQAPVVRVRPPYSEQPAYGGFFVFWEGKALRHLLTKAAALRTITSRKNETALPCCFGIHPHPALDQKAPLTIVTNKIITIRNK